MYRENTLNNSTLIPEEENEDSVSLLWLPYVLLSLFLLAMAFSSFFHYHSKNKGKYFHAREVQVQPEKMNIKETNKYRVTMSRNGKVASINFNILDYTNCPYEEEMPADNPNKHAEHNQPSKNKSTEEKNVNDWNEPQHGVCKQNFHFLNRVQSDDETVNKNSTKHKVTSPAQQNSSITVLADINETEIKEGEHISDSHTNPPLYSSISHHCNHQRKIPKFSIVSRDVYSNEAYDSNCDSEKSLIPAHSNKFAAANIKSLKNQHTYYYNDSFESQESASAIKDDLHDKSSFSDDIYPTTLHGKSDISYNSSSKDSLYKTPCKHKNNTDRKSLLKKNRDIGTTEGITCTTISGHVHNLVQLKQPDILMHSDPNVITMGQQDLHKSSEQLPRSRHGMVQNRPQSLDLTKASDKKGKQKLTNGYTLPSDLWYIQL